MNTIEWNYSRVDRSERKRSERSEAMADSKYKIKLVISVKVSPLFRGGCFLDRIHDILGISEARL